MRYSKNLLVYGLNRLHFKTIWSTPAEQFSAKRARWEPLLSHRPRRVARRITIEEFSYEGWIYHSLVPKDGAYDRCIFYSHGGGYVLQSTYVHWEFLAELCEKTRSKIIVPHYPLAPEYTKAEVFPWLRALCQTLRSKAGDKPWILMGDSAGGGLSLALALSFRDEGLDPFAAVVLISPWLDISMDSVEMRELDKRDPILSLEGLLACGRAYLGNGRDDLDSSPLHGDFRGLGALSVFTGSRDLLHPNARAFKQNCEKQGVALDYYVSEGSLHIFPLLRTADGLKARAKIIADVNANVTA